MLDDEEDAKVKNVVNKRFPPSVMMLQRYYEHSVFYDDMKQDLTVPTFGRSRSLETSIFITQ